MSSILSKYIPAEANRPASTRLQSLKLRTLLIALTALASGFIGLQLMAAPLFKVISLAYRVSIGQGSLPPVDVPVMIANDVGYWLPQAAFLLVTTLAIVGFSAGVFGKTRARVVMIPPLLLGLAMMVFIPSTSQWMHGLPGQLERDIMHGRYDAADRALKEVETPVAIKQYVQAQIALRANDEQALRANVEPVLKLVDQLVYGAPGIDPTTLQATAQFNPEVIHALDVRLNGTPQTEVGMRWEKENASRSMIATWLATVVRLIAGLALITVALGLSGLWNRMRRRVQIIQTEIEPAEHAVNSEINDLELDREVMQTLPLNAPHKYEPMTEKEMARADAMSAHLGLTLEPVTPSKRGVLPNATTPEFRHADLAAEVEQSSWLHRHGKKIGLVSVLLLATAYPVWKRLLVVPAEQREANRAAHPCKFVGDWTAARDQSVYKVTLKDNGDFVAQPISRGTNTDGTIRGKWAVLEEKMAWNYDGADSPPTDINAITNVTARSFTLTEVNGSKTQYALIDAKNTANCPR